MAQEAPAQAGAFALEGRGMRRKRGGDAFKRETDRLIADIRALNQEAKVTRDEYARLELYRAKSKLQNHLLRQYGEHFEAYPDPEWPGTLSLTRLSDGRDACHVRVDALDPDVRGMLGI